MIKTPNSSNCFDFLRLFFALNIIVEHLATLSQNQKLHSISNYSFGDIGIRVFFIISGFLVAKSYLSTKSLKKYFIKRAKRVFPAYIFVILFFTITLSLTSSFSFLDYFFNQDTMSYLGWNLVFLNFLHPCLPGVFESNLYCVINGSLWTLKVEEGFYVFLPFLFFVMSRFSKKNIILLLLYVLSVLYWYVMQYEFKNYELAKQLPGSLAYFISGIVLFLNFDYLMMHNKNVFILAIILFSISLFLTLKLDFFYPISLGVIIIISAYHLPFLNNFGKYGDFTYGIYIYHFPIIQLFRHYNLFEVYNPYLMAMCVLILTFLGAIFSWFVIEKRFLDRYKKGQINAN